MNWTETIAMFRRLRLERKLRIVDLAETIGVSETILGQWERGYRTPTAFNLQAWAEALDCEILVKRKGAIEAP